MLDIRKLKELVRLMVANDLTEVDLRDAEEQVTLRRHHHNQVAHVVAAAPAMHGHSAHMAPPHAGAATAMAPPPGAGAGAGAAETDDAEAGLHQIVSPMVGTFYAASSPDSPPFVKVGAPVGPDSTVCLIEAMKIFNEIKAECSGTIERVLVDSGDSVDFGQPIFLVRPR